MFTHNTQMGSCQLISIPSSTPPSSLVFPSSYVFKHSTQSSLNSHPEILTFLLSHLPLLPRYDDQLESLPPQDRQLVDELEREVMGALAEVARLSQRLGVPLPQQDQGAAGCVELLCPALAPIVYGW